MKRLSYHQAPLAFILLFLLGIVAVWVWLGCCSRNLFICSDFEKKVRPLPGEPNFRPASASIIKLFVLSRLGAPLGRNWQSC